MNYLPSENNVEADMFRVMESDDYLLYNECKSLSACNALGRVQQMQNSSFPMNRRVERHSDDNTDKGGEEDEETEDVEGSKEEEESEELKRGKGNKESEGDKEDEKSKKKAKDEENEEDEENQKNEDN